MKKTAITILITTIILFGGLRSYHQTKAMNQPQAFKKITIAQAFEVFLYAPLYIAEDKGFFKEEGLDVTIVTAGGDEKAFASLLSGDAQFAVGDPTFVAVSGEQGQPGKVVAAVLRGTPFWGVAKKTEIKPITEPRGLGKYSVATFPSPSTAYTLQKNMFKLGNIKPNIKEIAFGSLLASLDTGAVDIALELEPNVSTAVRNGAHIVYSLNDYSPEFAITGMTALPNYIKQNPDTTQKIVNALQKAMSYIHQHPNETSNLLIKKFPDVSKDIAADAVKNMIAAGVFPEDTRITKNGWDAAIKARLDAGDLKQPANYENYVITYFSDNAK